MVPILPQRSIGDERQGSEYRKGLILVVEPDIPAHGGLPENSPGGCPGSGGCAFVGA